MFTGIVESTATTRSLTASREGGRLMLENVAFAAELALGESVAVNGCCLTVVESGPGWCAFDLLAETLRVTNLGSLSSGDLVNLERSLRADSRLSGHFVQGHIDTTAEILAYEATGQDHRLVVALPHDFRRLTAPRGSIAVDGISLTIAELADSRFTIWITPHTHEVTTLRRAAAGQRVNLEFDMLAKYLDRMLEARGLNPALA
jgi:riboflavin synthase